MLRNTSLLVLNIILVVQLNAQSLNQIESAEYDPINHRFLISNASSVVEVDGNGTAVAYFGTAPAASYGMEVMGNALYTIVGSAVKSFDLTTGLLISNITITGAQFLNGMASDDDYRIWVTDFNGKTIYEIDYTVLGSPTYVQVVSNTVTTPNGICYDGVNDRLVFVNWGGTNAKIKAVALSDYAVTTLVSTSGIGNIDGIDNDNYGNFYVASWSPNRVTKFSSEFAVSEIITVVGGLDSPADIAYAEDIDTLIIPNSGNGTVRFVGFSPSSVQASNDNPFAFECYPNPLNDKSVLSFVLTEAAVTKIEIMDAQGRLVEKVLEENLPATKHKIVLGDLGLSSGNYLWRITNGDTVFFQPFLK